MQRPIYSHNSSLASDLPLLVLEVEGRRCAPDNEGFLSLHWHEEVQFLYVLAGSAVTRVYDQSVTVSAGEGLFINRNAVHLTRGSEDCRYHSFLLPTQLLTLSLSGETAARYVSAVTERTELPCLLLREETHGGVLTALRALDAAYQADRGDPLREYRLSLRVGALWLALLEVLPPEGAAAGRRDRERIHALLAYLHAHYAEPFTVRELAASAYLSETECRRCFHTCLGISPYQYLLRYRLSMAASRLASGRESVTEIAGAVGFSSGSALIQQFRRVYGVTPRAWRRGERAGNGRVDDE